MSKATFKNNKIKEKFSTLVRKNYKGKEEDFDYYLNNPDRNYISLLIVESTLKDLGLSYVSLFLLDGDLYISTDKGYADFGNDCYHPDPMFDGELSFLMNYSKEQLFDIQNKKESLELLLEKLDKDIIFDFYYQ